MYSSKDCSTSNNRRKLLKGLTSHHDKYRNILDRVVFTQDCDRINNGSNYNERAFDQSCNFLELDDNSVCDNSAIAFGE